MNAYAGIGSRETPDDVITLMHHTAGHLAAEGWTLRSGNAPGADQAFALGHLASISGSPIELYLPWKEFEPDALSGWTDNIIARTEPQPEAYPIAQQFHPNWAALKRGGRALQARNVHQILGHDVTQPSLSKFVLCWTPGARGGGGTGQALRIARHYSIPIFDLADTHARNRIQAWLTTPAAA